MGYRYKSILNEFCRLAPEGHRQYLLETCQKLNAEEVLFFLDETANAVYQRWTGADACWLAFLRETDLAMLWGYDRLVQIYRLADQRQDRYLQMLLLRGQLRDELLPLGDEEPPRISKAIESYTLGERRAMAKGRNVRHLQMLTFDSDFLVIQNLLNNQRLDEGMVLKIASRRPQLRRLLIEILAHRKWGNSYAVRKAICFNPAAPPYLMAGLLNFLAPRDVKLWLQMQKEVDHPLVTFVEQRLALVKFGSRPTKASH